MMKIFTVLLAAMGVLGSFSFTHAQQYQTYPSNETYTSGKLSWQNDFNTASGLSKSTSKPIVILFTGTSWCPACMRLERDVLTKPEFANAVGDKFIFMKAEFPSYSSGSMSSSPYKGLLDQYKVEAFPTIIVVDANGQVLYTVSYQAGGPDVYANALLSKLNQVRSATATPSYTY